MSKVAWPFCGTFCSYFYHWMRGKNSLVSLGPVAEFSPAFTARKKFGRAVNAMVFQSKFGGPEFKSRPCPDFFTKSQVFSKIFDHAKHPNSKLIRVRSIGFLSLLYLISIKLCFPLCCKYCGWKKKEFLSVTFYIIMIIRD